MMRVRIGEFVAAVCVVAWGVAQVWAAPWCDRCEVERETTAQFKTVAQGANLDGPNGERTGRPGRGSRGCSETGK